jgi:GT2 family glycosyltransferase/glycosyltransferase involved in cell wall biosynthesis
MPINMNSFRLSRWRALYHRLPLPPRLKRFLGFVYRKIILKGVHVVSRKLSAAGPAAHKYRPQAKLPERPDYIIWGVIDWNFRHQRPQQLAQALSVTGRRVFYVSSELKNSSDAGFTLQPLDQSGMLFQVNLSAHNAPVIYHCDPDREVTDQLRRSMGEVLIWAQSEDVISVVQHPFWYDIARALPDSRLVYDCMDHHQGFGNNAEAILKLEQQLISHADLRLFTSDWLAQLWQGEFAGRSAIVRNAADFAEFSTVPDSVYRDRLGRLVIGYFGAIAEWFDTELVARISEAFPQHVILLIGADTVGAGRQLSHCPNVEFMGEVAYTTLPYYLHGFDVCILPFRLNPLTLATNPVKVYEYLSAGKPVVSVELPEIAQFGPLVYAARGAEQFIAAITAGLTQNCAEQIASRQLYASQQTWSQRVDGLITQAESPDENVSVSIIIVTFNNLALTQACLGSIETSCTNIRLEIIVVDNASTDGTPEFLQQWGSLPERKIILNNDNRGFSAANNQGLAVAQGDYLVLLNNDTQVTPGWLTTLQRHLQANPDLGLIGPVTNNIGNQAKVDLHYTDLQDMPAAARRYTRSHLGVLTRLPTLAFFCVMLPRSTYEKVGPLDEAFGLGFFEDDDYCRRIEQVGLACACARDVFVHHHLSASFDQMIQTQRQALFERNKAIYEAKWGAWIPHTYD